MYVVLCLVFCSCRRWVVHQLMEKKKDKMANWIQDLLATKNAGLYFGVLKGRLFEDYAIGKLMAGGTFKVDKLTPVVLAPGVRRPKRKRADMEITIQPLARDDIIDEMIDIEGLHPNRLAVPLNPNFPVLDACMVAPADDQLFFFQMKHVASQEHQTLKRVHLNRLRGYRVSGGNPVGQWSHKPLKFFKVVPDFSFNKSTIMELDPAAGAAIAADEFEQWKLAIPMEI